MTPYITGSVIRQIREQRHMTQSQLAEAIHVSDKAVSKWENGNGFPDITLLEDLAKALGISVVELLSGSSVQNTNRSFNMKKTKFYVCPVCGNVLTSSGESVICCCGITLPPLEEEIPDEAHRPVISNVEDEYYVELPHEMTRQHNISFIAALQDNAICLYKLYPESEAYARFKTRDTRKLYWYCNHHGLFSMDVRRQR